MKLFKKAVSFLICFALLTTALCCLNASAVSYTEGFVTYSFGSVSNGYTLTGISVEYGTPDITIPSSYSGVAVVGVSNNALQNNAGISSLTIPNTVTSIGSYAFANMNNLKSVTFVSGNSTVSLGKNAFYQCSALQSIVFPTKITSIPASCFEGCRSLTAVNIPSTVTSIQSQAFLGCSSLSGITIPAGVTSIGTKAFYNCQSVTSYSVNSGNGNYKAVGGCLMSYDGSQFIQYPIGSSAVSYTLPSGVKSISVGAFGFSELQSVSLSSGLTDIGGNAFSYCTSLSSISIPNTVTTIGVSAFLHCSALKSVTIPASVTDFESAFTSCGLESVTLASGLKKISGQAFSDCTSLKTVTIPSTVTEIEFAAFYGCTSLGEVSIPSSVTTFGNDAFGSCPSLTIVAEDGSAAAQYASANSIKFSSSGSSEPDDPDIFTQIINFFKSIFKAIGDFFSSLFG